MTKQEVIKKLKELKENTTRSTVNEDCRDALNICYNLQDDGDYDTEYITSQIVQEDLLSEYITHRLKEYWAMQVARDLKGISEDSEWFYIDDVYGTVESVDADKLKDLIDEMVDAIGE